MLEEEIFSRKSKISDNDHKSDQRNFSYSLPKKRQT